MTVLTEQENGWINGVATRLRLIQCDTARFEPARRSEFLQEELDRSFKPVSPANRKRLLTALLERFPVAGRTNGTAPAPAATAPSPAHDEPPVQVFARLMAIVRDLPADQRTELLRPLLEAAGTGTARASTPLQISEESQRALGLSAGQSPRWERLAELSVMLLDVLSRLDQTSLRTLEVLSPRSSLLKRNESIRRAAGRFLVGDTDTIEPQLRDCAALVGALLAASLGGGRIFGQQYLERFAPLAIEDVVKAEGGGGMFGRNTKERCWERYVDLARDMATPDLIERKVRECLALVVQRTAEKAGVGIR